MPVHLLSCWYPSSHFFTWISCVHTHLLAELLFPLHPNGSDFEETWSPNACFSCLPWRLQRPPVTSRWALLWLRCPGALRSPLFPRCCRRIGCADPLIQIIPFLYRYTALAICHLRKNSSLGVDCLVHNRWEMTYFSQGSHVDNDEYIVNRWKLKIDDTRKKWRLGHVHILELATRCQLCLNRSKFH